MNFKNTLYRNQSGVSLIEVLVSIIIMSVGLLGLAALQNTSLKFSYDSYLRTQASLLANDIADRIRANPNGGIYNLSSTNQIQEPTNKCDLNSTGCSENDIRLLDLWSWRQQVNQLLPSALLELSFDPVNSIYRLRIEWEDRYRKDANDASEDPAAQLERKEFIYSFKV